MVVVANSLKFYVKEIGLCPAFIWCCCCITMVQETGVQTEDFLDLQLERNFNRRLFAQLMKIMELKWNKNVQIIMH